MTRPPAPPAPREPLRVLVAPDKFKGSLSGQQAADAIAAGAQDAAAAAAPRRP